MHSPPSRGPGMLVGLFVCLFVCGVRPPLNKKLFPVNWPGGSKRADWNFFFHLFKKKKKKKI